MRAFLLDGYGDASRTGLREVPKPSPSASELLVRVEAAGLNPVDYKIRAGKLRVVQDYRMPVVMGCELAGVVDDEVNEVNGLPYGLNPHPRNATRAAIRATRPSCSKGRTSRARTRSTSPHRSDPRP